MDHPYVLVLLTTFIIGGLAFIPAFMLGEDSSTGFVLLWIGCVVAVFAELAIGAIWIVADIIHTWPVLSFFLIAFLILSILILLYHEAAANRSKAKA